MIPELFKITVLAQNFEPKKIVANIKTDFVMGSNYDIRPMNKIWDYPGIERSRYDQISADKGPNRKFGKKIANDIVNL